MSVLAHRPAEVIRQLLIDSGLGIAPTYPGVSADWSAYSPDLPDRPDRCISIRDVDNQMNGREMFTGRHEEFHGVQLVLRSVDPDSGHAKAAEVVTYLDSYSTLYDRLVTVGAVAYLVHSFDRSGGILYLGDESPSSRRSLFSINAMVTIRRLA